MDSPPVRRPHVSRETRLLLTTAFLAVVALWLLARLRYPDAVTAPASVPPILAPLVPRQSFTDLADQLADVAARTTPSLLPLRVASSDGPESYLSALRIRDDVAVGLLAPADASTAALSLPMIAYDSVTGLTLLRVPQGPPAAPSAAWPRRDLSLPRYLMRSDAFAEQVSLFPIVTSGLHPIDAPLWSDAIWAVRSGAEFVPGTFVFSAEGDWVGLAVRHHGSPAVVPAEVVTRHAEQLLARVNEPGATLGLEVQELSPALSRVTAATRGVVVAWVADDGPAAASIQVGDVLVAADGRSMPTLEHWQRYLADLRVGATTTLTVRTDGEDREVKVTTAAEHASARETAPPQRPDGLTTRPARGGGAEITAVQPGSMASAAGLRVGDVITKIGDVSKPTPAQVRQVVAVAAARGPILVAVDREGSHRVMVLEP